MSALTCLPARRRTSAAIILFTIVGCSLYAASVPAQTVRDRARAKLVQGAKLYERGDFAGALRTFEAAQNIFPSGKVYYNIGLAQRALGKWAKAIAALRRFVQDPGDATPELIGQGRALLDQLSKKVAFVWLSSDSEPADVIVDGARVGTIPAPAALPLEPGKHEILLSSPAAGMRTRTMEVTAGQSLQVRINYKDAPAGPPPTTPPPLAANTSPGTATAGARAVDRPSAAAAAEALIAQARQLREAGRDARAHPLLLRAYEIETTPRTAAQLGLVEMQLGYWLAAERHLTESLSAPRDPWVKANRTDLETSLTKARSAIGEVAVAGSPPGASVIVNGWEAGKLPLATPVRVGEGPLHLEVRAAGFETARQSLKIEGGQRSEVTVALQRSGAGEATASRPPLLPPGGARANDREDATAQSGGGAADARDDGGRGFPFRPVAWAAAGTGAALAGFALFETLQYRRHFDHFQSYEIPRMPGQPQSALRDCGANSPNHGAPGCDQIYRNMQTTKQLAIAGYAAGGLLGAGGLALWLLTPARTPATEVACAPSLSLAGASCRLSFR